MKNKTLWIVLLVGALVLVAGFGATLASAASTRDYPPIVQKLADRFNLDVNEVDKVFDEECQGRCDKKRGGKCGPDGKCGPGNCGPGGECETPPEETTSQ